MKMKQISALMVGVWRVSETLAQEREIPKSEQVISIELKTTPTLWRVWFYSNGVATLDYGGTGGPNPQMDTSPESFPIKEVYSLLAPLLKPRRDHREDTFVVFSMGGTNMYVGYIEQAEESKAVVRKLMQELYNKATIPGHYYSKEVFEEVLATRPFLWGDLPPLFEYDKAYRSANREKIEAFMRDDVIMRWAMQGRIFSSPEEAKRAIEVELAKWKAEIGFADTTEENDADKPPTNRPWLYVGILSALCVGAVLWLIRRKRR